MFARKKNSIPPLGAAAKASASGGSDVGVNTLIVHGRKLVGGLLWEPLESYRNYMAEAKRIGKQRKMDMVAIRKSDSAIQAGFAPRTKERLKGHYSLAATLAGSLGESWMGAFELEDGRYALVTVIDGIVLPGQDIIGDRERISAELNKTYSLVTADPVKAAKLEGKIIAPASFNFSNDNRAVAEIIGPDSFRKEYLLRQLTLGLTAQQIALGGVAAAAVVAAGAGVLYWMEKREQAEREALALAQATEQKRLELEAARAIPQPWTSQPDARKLLGAAAMVLEDAPLSIAGWSYAESACDSQQCALIYRRAPGGTSIGAFLSAGAAAGGKRLDDGTGVIYSKLELAPEKGDLLSPIAEREYSFVNYFQAFGPYVSTSITAAAAVAPADSGAPKPTWLKREFTIGTAFPPELLLEGLDTTGLRITKIVAFVPSTETANSSERPQTQFDCSSELICWNIQGELYGR
ncbi:TPA: type 4b pilus protein PilO2 [Stenotrophomonas maltophilia]|jgi:hypothetical protein|uniref:Type 4b pilus protein PilO2 n=2 Tax=Stenotrophomonas maltophilia TaxID=40324 RepID=A0AAI9G0D9_STEMA|nr:type 4b pilus protein PilO2 [Stenotrophomonas maltophilia]EKU9962471.1 type 4b pilus protein PilO2 [Stenotrophomonas maltophilia]EKZ1926560.1 type 4b pilus protein PilO2 [Stenotrophomonas maltophilia]ELE7121251.1 type 4b pilus protein PilO2 [Stenotrophomonas maltophilia]EMB2746807.1 type 4b pilus protein PilO2 [Stenotrophomonas maltophilia]MBH1377201.1 type 4b pilus protein PilO2 [Stenotrophomonas maltophilia]